MPVFTPRRIEYKPYPIRNLLREMKNLVSTILDLSYYSVLYSDKMMAYRVLKIENEIDEKWALVVMQSMMAARTPDDSESLLSIVRIANSLDEVSDAAGDIAYVVTTISEGTRIIVPAITQSEEWVARIKIVKLQKKTTLNDLVAYPRHADVLVLVRNQDHIIDPPLDMEVKANDEVILRGTEEAIKSIAQMVGYRLNLPILSPQNISGEVQRLWEKASWMKNIADIALDLAFHSVVYSDKSSAMEVLEIEEEVDSEYINMLRFINDSKELSVDEKISLTVLFSSLEKITDAASQMASIVIANIPIHEIIEIVEEESNEIILKAIVTEKLDGKTIEGTGLDDIGAHVVAVKKESGGWIPLPSPMTKLKTNDIIILKIYSEKDESLMDALASRGLSIIED